MTTSVGTLNIVTNIPDVQEPSDSIYAPVINSDSFGRLQGGLDTGHKNCISRRHHEIR
jgi:hypothetical protein